MTPEERSLRARMGGYAVAAKYDTREVTRPARDAFMAKFDKQVDPDGKLPEAERERRAQAAMQLHMRQLAWRRWKPRRTASKS